jgi:hypothetical protein
VGLTLFFSIKSELFIKKKKKREREIGEKDVPKCILSKTGRYSSSDTWEALRVKYTWVDW